LSTLRREHGRKSVRRQILLWPRQLRQQQKLLEYLVGAVRSRRLRKRGLGRLRSLPHLRNSRIHQRRLRQIGLKPKDGEGSAWLQQHLDQKIVVRRNSRGCHFFRPAARCHGDGLFPASTGRRDAPHTRQERVIVPSKILVEEVHARWRLVGRLPRRAVLSEPPPVQLSSKTSQVNTRVSKGEALHSNNQGSRRH
jgi:hypothetical protein